MQPMMTRPPAAAAPATPTQMGGMGGGMNGGIGGGGGMGGARSWIDLARRETARRRLRAVVVVRREDRNSDRLTTPLLIT
jgi:hypothetical protein